MLTRNKLPENADPRGRVIMPKKVVTEGLIKPIKCELAKVKKPAIGQNRRAAFGDITNATNEPKPSLPDKKKPLAPVKPIGKSFVNVTCNKATKPVVKKKTEIKRKIDPVASLVQKNIANRASSSTSISDQKPSVTSTLSSKGDIPKSLQTGEPVDRFEEDFSFITVEEVELNNGTDKPDSMDEAERSLLAVDVENYTDVFNVGIYAQHIFDYYKCREKMFPMSAYLTGQYCRVTPPMRAILVDWMVEVQENFELNHEALYLAVKLTDMFLSRTTISKEVLQLIGAATIFIASKFEERLPPLIEDFIYICDNAFDRDQFISMEIEILKTVDFDLGIPISYTFLRRYAKVARVSIVTLTLARFILEMSLMEYDFVVARDSKLAAAALYIAQKMKSDGTWGGDVVKASGYIVEDFKQLIEALNKMLHARPIPQLSTIRTKYSHQVFHEVAKIAPLSTEQLLQL